MSSNYKDIGSGVNESTDLKKLQRDVSSLELKLRKIKNSTARQIKQLEKDKVSFVTVSGTFVSIFTFISVEVQFLRYICDFNKIIGLTFIFGGILIGFIFLIDWIAKSWLSTKDTENYAGKLLILGVVFISLMSLGVSYTKKSENLGWKCELQDDNIKTQINITK